MIQFFAYNSTAHLPHGNRFRRKMNEIVNFLIQRVTNAAARVVDILVDRGSLIFLRNRANESENFPRGKVQFCSNLQSLSYDSGYCFKFSHNECIIFQNVRVNWNGESFDIKITSSNNLVPLKRPCLIIFIDFSVQF